MSSNSLLAPPPRAMPAGRSGGERGSAVGVDSPRSPHVPSVSVDVAMHLTATARYALKAVVALARLETDGRAAVPMAEIAGVTGVPRNYLSKILHRLTVEGVLRSTRGPGGGFSLAVPAETLLLATVIAPFGTDGRGILCLLEDRPCDLDRPCVAHDEWVGVARVVADFFQTMTVGQLVAAS